MTYANYPFDVKKVSRDEANNGSKEEGDSYY